MPQSVNFIRTAPVKKQLYSSRGVPKRNSLSKNHPSFVKFNAHMEATQRHIGEYKTHASKHFHSKLIHQSQPDLNELKKQQRKRSKGSDGLN